jgi:hypothetical protein
MYIFMPSFTSSFCCAPLQELRPAVFALRAFNIETALVADQVKSKEPAMVQVGAMEGEEGGGRGFLLILHDPDSLRYGQAGTGPATAHALPLTNESTGGNNQRAATAMLLVNDE